MLKKLAILLLVLCLAAGAAADADAARKKSAKKPAVDRYASIVMDAETGYVLSERNADKQLHPASLTKMMTLYMTFDAIRQGKLSKNTRLPVSKFAASQDPSKLNLKAGGSIRVEDAILALVTKSANDAATVLAEGVGGSQSRFATLMTQKARQLGMTRTRFINASGLHHPAQISSARDMARLSQALLRDFPREYKYFSTNNFSYAGHNYHNHNRLMSSYQGMDGIKTGYINASGYNLAASAVRGNRRLIGVVFGGRTTATRNAEMARLLDAGFEKARNPTIARNIQNSAKTGTQTAATTPATSNTTKAVIAAATSQQVNIAQARRANDNAPEFNALALVPVEQGDTEDASPQNRLQPAVRIARGSQPVSVIQNNRAATGGQEPAKVINFRAPQQGSPAIAAVVPQPKPSVASAGAGGWAVQVGAFASHDAGMTALRNVHVKLPKNITQGSQYTIAPLMTNRGMIYRARLAGLGRDNATAACRILQGNCLILAVQ
jgi:D-alanyl-D-alanine carboxypeptidase